MLGPILAKTPLWVWALLAFLIYRGLIASVDREIALKKTFIIPLVMLGLSMHGIASAFGANPAASLAWLASMLATSAFAVRFANGPGITAAPERGTIFQQGSWTPMMLMMGIFFTKYVVAVMLATHADYRQDAAFAVAICALYGVFNGIFIGNLLRILGAYRRASADYGYEAAPLAKIFKLL